VYGFGEANKRCGFKQTIKYKVKEGRGGYNNKPT